ncbi:hypothetical protein [Actinomadura hibisca]|uniref:hypothetical protein n=1 Tax=Actinomadura hibisca TaxID=68565 RepID=UPI0012FC48FD|nr:hypothetical protein [Actinomadura hibisca]
MDLGTTGLKKAATLAKRALLWGLGGLIWGAGVWCAIRVWHVRLTELGSECGRHTGIRCPDGIWLIFPSMFVTVIGLVVLAVMLGNYPPRRVGLAAFVAGLALGALVGNTLFSSVRSGTSAIEVQKSHEAAHALAGLLRPHAMWGGGASEAVMLRGRAHHA